MIKIVFSIRSLDIGGAERQFIELVKNIDKSRFKIYVCVMYRGVLDKEIENLKEVGFIKFDKKHRYDLSFYFKYKKFLKEIQPKVIYSFLGEMNLFSLWCKPKNTKLIWGFRASNMDLKKYGKVPQILFWLQKKQSFKVDKIIANSNASIEFHKKKGFNMKKAIVIHNGIDTNRFKRNETKRIEFRKKYNLSKNDIAIGIVARIDYMKGYTIFAKTAKRLLKKYDNLKFFSIGDGDKNIKKECEEILGSFNNTRFIWLGKQRNVEDFYSGFDISSSSSSFGEGFSNSIAEAMSSEVPCVVSDVGDSKIIVGECGEVVLADNVDSFCDGLEKMIQEDIIQLGKCSRKRILENFSIEKMVKRTEKEILKCAE
ncbi:glycosyltransferase [Sulfurimonas sp. SWIR-19]|uniref:glycosyltransferase n=1 Tax=Sulfurimonas sp. SWIR-19 TaxID=2878390 RepID=UPI001CF3EC79|nr:glycosyltransferase [Sulfurimonas sp. SWIR-19]UCN01134.1 glycosyltransferase [Sulfurimonas sp. SWIR-19]